MWAKVIFSATLLPMLVHSILGCCWHHAHSDAKLNGVSSANEVHCCHEHHRSQHNDPVPPAPCDHDESCNELICVYIAADPIQNLSALEFYEHAATLDCCCSLILNATVPALAATQQCPKVPLPSEHCALTQVWVV